MPNTEPIVRCPVCGRHYRTFSMMVGDQSMCGRCRQAAEEAADRPPTHREAERRARHFDNH